MHLFTCQTCGQMLYFENSACTRCGSALGFLPDRLLLSVVEPAGDGTLSAAAAEGVLWRACANAGTAGCNWLTAVADDNPLCRACRLNRTIPDLGVAKHAEAWAAIEVAKRRLVYALLRFGLPLSRRDEEGEDGIAFDFLADQPAGAPVMTGHDDGLITINIAEADPVERERRRAELGEVYRTLIGHLRHEVGHYYWDLLVQRGGRTEASRALFGDERLDYAEALERHYAEGPPTDWQANFVSSYATMHPWEDFAETWTHYLHIVDTLDTAASFGLAIAPVVSEDPALEADLAFDPYRARTIDRLVDAWLPLTYAVNSLNRSMGQADLYPFVLSAPVIEKLGFVHDLVRAGSSGRPPGRG